MTMGGMGLKYVYSATQNDGRIDRMKNWITGEDVNYQYDSLKRLISASTAGPEWGQSYTYDGFGNLLTKAVTKGSATTLNLTVDPLTNRTTNSGATYSPSGEQLGGLGYDVDGRVISIGYPYNVDETYGYDAGNRRVWRSTSYTATQIFFTDLGGRLLGVCGYQTYIGQVILSRKTEQERTYLAGRLVSQGDPVYGPSTTPKVDRLGSVYQGANTSYLPYGEERTPTTQDMPKFGTYERGLSGLDYAVNRHSASTWGRFTSADPMLTGNARVLPRHSAASGSRTDS
jgi:YD repeat-containing protein